MNRIKCISSGVVVFLTSHLVPSWRDCDASFTYGICAVTTRVLCGNICSSYDNLIRITKGNSIMWNIIYVIMQGV